MWTRRRFIEKSLSIGALAAPFSFGPFSRHALGQLSPSTYKAIVVITLDGGNDANNMLVPLDAYEYAQYSALRGNLSLPASSLLPLLSSTGSSSYGLHPKLPNIAALYSQNRAAVVANIGPLAQPTTKQMLTVLPQVLESHPIGQARWESATVLDNPTTGWGGRVADLLKAQSGSLPPVLNTAQNSIFTVGETVQGIVLQSGGTFAAIPSDLNAVVLQMANDSSTSTNRLVSQVAAFRAQAMQQQVMLDKALQYATIKQHFTGSPIGRSLQTTAQLLGGRSTISASRQIFYVRQGGYDTHSNQINGQGLQFSDLDNNLGSFFAAIDDLGLSDQVLVCTHSDFGRTMTGNSVGGTDHGWGNHQLVLGGGIRGGRIIGMMPSFELGGSDDISGQGIWIPTLSVSQLAAAIAAWMGLNTAQLNQVFPDLINFKDGALELA